MKQPLALVPPLGADIEVHQHERPEKWTATVRIPVSGRVALHRIDDPMGEARAHLSICRARDPRVIAIVGAGLGFLTEAAHERYPNARIVVLEPVPLLAHSAVARTPGLYASGRIKVVAGPEFGGSDLW